MSGSESINKLLDDGIIDDVLGRIMSGKEAEVFAVTRGGQPCAAKVYKDREHRNFKNNSGYLEGRADVRDSRSRRAMAKGSRFGRQVQERGWKEMEHDALSLAFHAGVRVPQPIFLYEDTLLMQLVVDEEGMPAPRLSDVELGPDEAAALHQDLFDQIRKLLSCHRIHGDLSAYNVLMGVEGPTIIDMPQVVDAAANPRAEEFLTRDVRNITEYLARFQPRLQAFAHAGRVLWRHYRSGTLEQAVAQAVAEDFSHQPRRRGRPGEGRPHTHQQPQRVVHPDGRVEVVVSTDQRRRNQRFSRGGGGQGPRRGPHGHEERSGRPHGQDGRHHGQADGRHHGQGEHRHSHGEGHRQGHTGGGHSQGRGGHHGQGAHGGGGHSGHGHGGHGQGGGGRGEHARGGGRGHGGHGRGGHGHGGQGHRR